VKEVAAAGNDMVVDALKSYLTEAKKGKINYIAIIATVIKGDHGIGMAGDAGMVPAVKRGLLEIHQKLKEIEDNNTMPTRDESLGEDYATYNLASCPVSFDFLYWLVETEMGRLRAGAPAPLKVSFWNARDGVGRLGEPGIKRMFEKVLRPMLALFGAVEVDASQIGRCRNVYTPRFIVPNCIAGEKVPMAHAPAEAVLQAIKYRDAVTITLREAKHWPHRNSKLKDWLRFARDLKARGERVVFIRDTEKAFEPIEGFETFPLASIDLLVRAAVYEHARFNLFVGNGPAALATFIDRPWFQFVHLEPDGHAYFPNTPTFWARLMGVEQGGQFPWCKENQRLIWADDTYEDISAAWERYGAQHQPMPSVTAKTA
jgi:hypothetical protein